MTSLQHYCSLNIDGTLKFIVHLVHLQGYYHINCLIVSGENEFIENWILVQLLSLKCGVFKNEVSMSCICIGYK